MGEDNLLPIFEVTKKRDGLLVRYVRTNHIDYLDWWEGWIYRLTKRIPDRFFRWHDKEMFRRELTE